MRKNTTLLLTLCAVAALTATGCGDDPLTPEAQTTKNLRAVAAVPTEGGLLGNPESPSALIVFAAPDDLRFATFVNEALPKLVDEHVEPGRLRIQMRTLARGQDDSLQLARILQAAGLQGKLWAAAGFIAAHYVGIIDDTFRAELVAAVPGLDATRLRRDETSPRVAAAIERAGDLAAVAGTTRFSTLLQPARGNAILQRGLDVSQLHATVTSALAP